MEDGEAHLVWNVRNKANLSDIIQALLQLPAAKTALDGKRHAQQAGENHAPAGRGQGWPDIADSDICGIGRGVAWKELPTRPRVRAQPKATTKVPGEAAAKPETETPSGQQAESSRTRV
eukprot:3972836-Amphidinium_carterae.1